MAKMLAADVANAAKDRFKAFLAMWWTDYKAFWGRDYVSTAGKDHGSTKRFLSSAKDYSLDEIMAVARKAWRRAKDDRFLTFTLKQSSTLSGFCNYFNQLVTELEHARNMERQP